MTFLAVARSGAGSSLAWKEVRELWPLVPLAWCLEAVAWTALVARRMPLDSGGATMLWTLGAVAVAALWGALFFGGETQQGTRGFLLALPIPPGRLLAGKVGVAVVGLGVWGGGSWTAFRVLAPTASPWPRDLAQWGQLALLVALAWCAAALCSLRGLEPLVAWLAALGLLAVGGGVVLGLEPGGRLVAATIALGIAAVALRRAVAQLEDHTGDDAAGALLDILPRLHLLDRPKTRVAALLVALPALCALAAGPIMAPFVLYLWAPLAGAIWGVLWVDPAERQVDSLTRHLPIRPLPWTARRLAGGWLLGGVLGAQLLLALRAAAQATPSAASVRPEVDAAAFLLGFLVAYALAFGFGALISPWTPHPVVGVLFVLITLGMLGDAVAPLSPDTAPLGARLALLAVLYGLVAWKRTAERAHEPGHGGIWRGLARLAPFWVLALVGGLW